MKQKNNFLKRTLACVMVIIMTLTAVPLSGFVGLELPKLFETTASAADTYTEGYLKYEVENGEATITGCRTSISGAFVIPGTLGGYPVTSIGYDAFENCTGLTGITIPDSVTNISGSAFNGCTGLKSVTIGSGVTSISSYAFNNTAWYNAQPDGNVYIGKVYYKYKGTMPENTSISIKDGTKAIADDAFYNCTGLIKITIPNSVTSIGIWAFYGCTGLKSVTIGSGVKSIGAYAFHKTEWYNSKPDGNVYIGKVYYEYKGTMPENTSITIKNGTKEISGYAFSDCTGLTKITIPDSVTSIGSSAFKNCTGLTSITIPDSVKSIGYSAFESCKGLRS
ncbi:MAG: leucine-rich repeat domain-containing protein, partial [Acutalibacteraceae bacterium]